MAAGSRRQQHFMPENRLPHIRTVQMPPERSVRFMMRCTENHPLHLAGQLARKRQHCPVLRIDKLHCSIPGGLFCTGIFRMIRPIVPFHGRRQHELSAIMIVARFAIHPSLGNQHAFCRAFRPGQVAGRRADLRVDSFASFGMTGCSLGMTGCSLGMTGCSLGMTRKAIKPFIRHG